MSERALRAGPLRARLVGAELRHARVGGVEVLRRLAVVVRDDAWGTVEPELETLEVEEAPGGSGFAVRARARCRRGALDLRWASELHAGADGSVTCALRVEPLADFPFNRIGLVVLHPLAGHAGRPVRGTGPDGPVAGELPELVGPQREAGGVLQPLFGPVRELVLAPAAGVELRFAFAGDLFELEDQRNWTDGSFKTYSTPLALGSPHRARPGRPIAQEVRLAVRGAPRGGDRDPDAPVEVGAEARAVPLPALGVGLAPGGEAPPPAAVAALRVLGPAHLRVDLPPGGEDALRAAARTASAVGCGLEVALAGAPPPGLASPGVPLARVLALGPRALDDPAAARAAVPVKAPVAGGTDGHFADLNRGRPDLGAFDGVAFPASPSVHLADDDALREGLEGLRDAVATARAVFGLPVHVGPVTLRPRRGPGSEPRGDEPPGTDPRQPTAFAAAWTLGAVAALTAGGAATATFYEAAGPRGVAAPDGTPFPLHAVLAALAPLAGAPARAAVVPDPLALAGLWVDDGLLLANLAARPLAVRAPALGLRPRAEALVGAPPAVDGALVTLPPWGCVRLLPR